MSQTYPYNSSGPSPRIRGESGLPALSSDLAGTIPANTGRIDPKGRSKDELRDHPREYGENLPDNLKLAAAAGPSPRIF